MARRVVVIALSVLGAVLVFVLVRIADLASDAAHWLGTSQPDAPRLAPELSTAHASVSPRGDRAVERPVEPAVEPEQAAAVAPLGAAAPHAGAVSALASTRPLRGGELEARAELARSKACEGELSLLGSIVHAADPARSLAAVRMQGGTRVLRVGQAIAGRMLVALRPRGATFREPDGALCELRVSPAPAPSARKAPAAPSAKKRGGSKAMFSEEELSRGIRALGPDSFALSRELLEKALGNLAQLRRHARYRFDKRDGRIEGVRLTALSPKSPLAKLGLRKGDVIRNLNGLALTDASGALEAFALVRSQRNFSLAVLREGAPRTLSYSVE